MQVGQRTYNPIKVGHKNMGNRRIGVKNFPSMSASSISAHTPNGVIYNYSNSADVAREPMKGVEIKTNKHKAIQIEKSRKRSDSGTDFN